jgi:dihydroneopterin aldolase
MEAPEMDRITLSAMRYVEGRTFGLLEGLAGALATGVLAFSEHVEAVTVRVRKLAVPMDVSIDHAEVEIHRSRQPT